MLVRTRAGVAAVSPGSQCRDIQGEQQRDDDQQLHRSNLLRSLAEARNLYLGRNW